MSAKGNEIPVRTDMVDFVDEINAASKKEAIKTITIKYEKRHPQTNYQGYPPEPKGKVTCDLRNIRVKKMKRKTVGEPYRAPYS